MKLAVDSQKLHVDRHQPCHAPPTYLDAGGHHVYRERRDRERRDRERRDRERRDRERRDKGA